jgi:hypothetical protein
MARAGLAMPGGHSPKIKHCAGVPDRGIVPKHVFWYSDAMAETEGRIQRIMQGVRDAGGAVCGIASV